MCFVGELRQSTDRPVAQKQHEMRNVFNLLTKYWNQNSAVKDTLMHIHKIQFYSQLCNTARQVSHVSEQCCLNYVHRKPG